MSDLETQWRGALAPSQAEFTALAQAAFAALPDAFRALCGDVVVQVLEFAPDDVLEHFKLDSPYEITGLYQGVDLTQQSVVFALQQPNFVFLYRQPILLEWCSRGDIALDDLITHVLVHEIGHHFGLSDEDMHAIEAAAD